MTSGPAARRPTLLGCALAVAVALLLPGCGEDGAAAPGAATAQAPRDKSEASVQASAADGCPGQLDRFLGSLASLRSRLAVGLSYEQYAAAIDGLGAAYERVPVEPLTIDCLTASGAPGERALNRYIDAANAWGECLADAACTTAEIEPVLQRRWRLASRSLSEAR
ncbi:MAG TPA: hypothetical protein VFR04_09675 [Solirubrobacterales bacterium]|nr:hypothetical protein [Solirubrobacterales bacterium]